MYKAIDTIGLGNFLKQEAPFGLFALVVAEFFYKFQSFALECAAFLATWYIASFAFNKLRRPLPGRAENPPAQNSD